jgi:hypothetical protein
MLFHQNFNRHRMANLYIDNNIWCLKVPVPYAKVGGPQISSEYRKSANLQTNFSRFADLPQMWQFADHIFFSICGFAICGPNYFLWT